MIARMPRILIADDEPNILDIMVDALQDAGYEVIGVRDGDAALKALKTEPYDLALIDVMMPKIDGYHLAAQIRSFKKPPKVVIVTSRDYNHDKNVLHAAGVDAFLPKPFSNKDLVEV